MKRRHQASCLADSARTSNALAVVVARFPRCRGITQSELEQQRTRYFQEWQPYSGFGMKCPSNYGHACSYGFSGSTALGVCA